MTILDSRRLSLGALKETDIPHLQIILGDEEVTRQTFGGTPMSSSASDIFIQEHFNTTGATTGLSPLREKQSSKIIGFAGLLPFNHYNQYDFEFGFVLAREAWGKGYATEVGKAQIDYAFNTLRLNRLFAMAAPSNKSSLQVIRKLGLQYKCDLVEGGRGLRQVYCIDK